MTAFEAILFDMDGVLLVGRRSHPGVYRAATHDALAELGVTDPAPEPVTALETGVYGPEMASSCDALGLDVDAWWRARERHASRRANARIRSGDRRVYPDAAAISRLGDRYPLGLVSNNRRDTVSFVAEYCFPGVFDAAVARRPTLADFERRKPDPAFIRRGLSQLGVTDALYVGDRGTDVIAAERAGIDAVLIEREHTTATPEVEPAAVIDSLTELPATVRSLTDR